MKGEKSKKGGCEKKVRGKRSERKIGNNS